MCFPMGAHYVIIVDILDNDFFKITSLEFQVYSLEFDYILQLSIKLET